jgi:hypothetical protein
MSPVANAEAMQVAVMTAPESIPAPDSTAGWTKMMYERAANVVAPATISVRMAVPDSRSWKKRLSDMAESASRGIS